MRKLYFLLTFSILGISAFAQQEQQWSNYMFNRIFYNPGYTGMTDGTCFSLFNRNQWVGFEGAPVTQNLTANIPVSFLGGGLGFNVINDNLGFMNDLALGMSYAYHINLRSGTLSIGVRADLMNRSIGSGGTWITPEGTSGEDDLAIVPPGSDGISFDGAFGLYYQTNNFWVGLSSVRLLETSTEFSAGTGAITEFVGDRTYFLAGGYNFNVPNTNVILTPTTLIKSNIGKTTVDAGLIATIDNRFWAGASWRREDAMTILAGFHLTPSIRLGYAYDANISPLRTENSGSHEFFVSYCFKIEIPPREKGMYRHPHFL
jgi:type IX secretion system PorP/SprF family membrane protein